MAMPGARKVAEAFAESNPEHEYADSYLAELRTSWRETEKGITRSSGLIVLFAVAFEFILGNKATASTFMGFHLTNTAIVQFSLVVIVAYLYYVVIVGWVESLGFLDVHHAVVKKVHPALYEADGQEQLIPAVSLLGTTRRLSISLFRFPGTGEGAAFFPGTLRILVVLVGPLLFLITAYVQLFIRYGLENGLLWTSLAIGAVLLLVAISVALFSRP